MTTPQSPPQSRYEDSNLRIFNPDDERSVVAKETLNEFEETVKICKEPTDEEWTLYENEKGPGCNRDEFRVLRKEIPLYKYRHSDVAALYQAIGHEGLKPVSMNPTRIPTPPRNHGTALRARLAVYISAGPGP
ncbi:hypothetical protein FAGAP_946 [Fusarium agapanthi]|uniref:Uncharacterized protein n=1 Tax=Fusarium agapanthi TaxID=1803897 RepID=A0A9P5EBK4_9HYPO|nr:hypothetical protein FAGAP_946 [Fusarium agapanthi]